MMFEVSLQDWLDRGLGTAEEWREKSAERYEAIKQSPHFHNWVPCAQVASCIAQRSK